MIDPGTRLEVASGVHCRPFDGELVVLNLARGEYYALDEVGSQIWEELARGVSVQEVAEKLETRYEIEISRLRQDIEALAQELVARGLMVERGASDRGVL